MVGQVLDNTMGATLVGVVVAAELHGVSCVQTYYYFTHSQKGDTWPLKLLVLAVMIFDTIHQILISHTLYTYVITNYDNPLELNNIVWSVAVEVLSNGLTAVLVQGFLTLRLFRLSDWNPWLTTAVVLLVNSEFGCVIAFVILSLQLHTYSELVKLKGLSITVNALAAAGDVLIAAILCTLLHRFRSGFRRSNTMINRLIIFTVNTGVVTSLCAIASLISITVAGNTFAYIGFYFCIGRFYTNSLLATLNARQAIREIGETQSTNLLSIRDSHGNGSIMAKRSQGINIKIDTMKEFAPPSPRGHGDEKLICGSMVGPFKEITGKTA